MALQLLFRPLNCCHGRGVDFVEDGEVVGDVVADEDGTQLLSPNVVAGGFDAFIDDTVFFEEFFEDVDAFLGLGMVEGVLEEEYAGVFADTIGVGDPLGGIVIELGEGIPEGKALGVFVELCFETFCDRGENPCAKYYREAVVAEIGEVLCIVVLGCAGGVEMGDEIPEGLDGIAEGFFFILPFVDECPCFVECPQNGGKEVAECGTGHCLVGKLKHRYVFFGCPCFELAS